MKKFKLPVIIIIMTLGFIKNSPAQTHLSGLYLTYNDFIHHKLSYSSDSDNQKNKIVLHEFFGGDKVTVTSNGKKQMLLKSQIFGYRDKHNHDYRFYGNKTYQIIDTAGFYLYSNEKLVQQGKGPKPTRAFYFSADVNASVLPLTEDYLATAFVKNNKFRYLVGAQFRSDDQLGAYDNLIHEFKIKELYMESTKE